MQARRARKAFHGSYGGESVCHAPHSCTLRALWEHHTSPQHLVVTLGLWHRVAASPMSMSRAGARAAGALLKNAGALQGVHSQGVVLTTVAILVYTAPYAVARPIPSRWMRAARRARGRGGGDTVRSRHGRCVQPFTDLRSLTLRAGRRPLEPS